MLTSGQLLAERYRLRHRIAVGGMGEVWQSVDVRLDRTVAVKVLKPELCGDAEFLHRFRTEARTTAALNHPGIAAVHDYGETAAAVDGPEDTAYLVMELVEGEPLAAILARNGRVNTEHTLDMLEQAGRALHAAHERGLVHRDVKPGNILITADGTVKITDFGIAKAADAAPVTRSGMVMGTAHYIAPEQALGADATPASDVYSLAVVGYECLMGHRPFLSDNAVTVAMMHIRDLPPPLPPDVPCGVRALVEATLVKDPRRRYGDGGEFAHAVASTRAGGPLPTPVAVHAATQSGVGPPPTTQGGTTQGGPASSGALPPVAPAPVQPAQPRPGHVSHNQLPVAQAMTPQQPAGGPGQAPPAPPGAAVQHHAPQSAPPPGVVPPQQTVPGGATGQHPGVVPGAGQAPLATPRSAAPQQHTNRAILVVVFVFGALVLVVIGVLLYWSLRDPGSTRSATNVAAIHEMGMTHTDLDSVTRLGHTAQRHVSTGELPRTEPGSHAAAMLHGRPRDTGGNTAHAARTTSGEPPGGHDGAGTIGRSLTRIGNDTSR